MAYRCTPETLEKVLTDFILTPFGEEVEKATRKGVARATKKLAQRTKGERSDGKAFPIDGGKWGAFGDYKGRPFPRKRRPGGTFIKHIKTRVTGFGMTTTGTWYVKSPEYRLTHLLENGHKLIIFGKARKSGRPTEAFRVLDHNIDLAEKEIEGDIVRYIK